ncbi:MAG TPA: ankyrin repeat domain-containing protein [Bryobacteraceae bacterium]
MNCALLRYALVAGSGALCVFANSIEGSLFNALRNGQMENVTIAIQNGAEVNTRDEYGSTLLMYAAVFGKVADLEYLLEHGAEINAANKAGHTALMRAIPDLAKIKLLVQHGANINAKTAEETTPLMIAAHIRTGAPLVRYLIEKGANVNATDNKGWNAVIIAAVEGAFENLKLLLNAGANGVARSSGSVLKIRSEVFAGAALENAKRRTTGITALINAAQADCEACVRLLLEHGADARAQTDSGLTALHRAAYHGNSNIVKLLLAAGAPVNAADDHGYTALMFAVNSRTKSPQAVRMLLSAGADADAKDALGRTVSQWAALGASRQIMAMLPARGTAETVKPVSLQRSETAAAVRTAVENSIQLLQNSGPKFFPKAGCISCHNVSIPMMALHAAGGHGYSVQPALQQMAKQTIASRAPNRENLLSGYCTIPAFTTTAGYDLISLHDAGYAPGLLTDAYVRCLLVEQLPNGEWSNPAGERPPLSAQTAIPGTALSARAVQLYATPALASQVKASVLAARTYLLRARPVTEDDYAYRLLGLSWSGANQSDITAAARDILARQRADGGWAQTPDMATDAFATGHALSAIAMTQPRLMTSESYRRGVDYLMRNQEKDGSWHVRSRAFGFQPYFDSGFPHGHDQWISMAATAYSAIALLPVAEPPRP